MLDFKKLDDTNACELCGFYKNGQYILSDYSIGLKRMWKDVLNPEFALSDGCLIVKNRIHGEVTFDYPLPVTEDHNIPAALNEIAKYCRDNYTVMKLSNVPEAQLSTVVCHFPRCEVSYNRKFSDYVYLTHKLAEMSGRTYSSHRNHIKKFYTQYPDATFRAFTKEDIPSVMRFLTRFSNVFDASTSSASDELKYARKMLERIGSGCFRCGGFVLDGEIISLCFCEKCGDTLIDHIEKALYEFEGIYPATVQAFLRMFGSDVKFFNREDDSADKGLRRSKLQYKPHTVAHKYNVVIKNELSALNEIPRFSSDRLTYSAITEEDIDAYNRLCLDDERNKYWGYDYRTVCPEPSRDYFYFDQLNDFKNRMTMSFAVRLNGNMIGEAILHDFDYKGSCEIGVRILPDFKGCGYGREALKAVVDHALYVVGVDSVRAKCYKENRQSSNMLSVIMREAEADDVFEHYVATF